MLSWQPNYAYKRGGECLFAFVSDVARFVAYANKVKASDFKRLPGLVSKVSRDAMMSYGINQEIVPRRFGELGDFEHVRNVGGPWLEFLSQAKKHVRLAVKFREFPAFH
jgi:hypothetical protein